MGKQFRGDVWFYKKVSGRTLEALACMNRKFAQEHSEDSNEALVEYVRAYADQLGHTPHKQEVIGSKFIGERFGGWGKVIVAANLPPTPPDPPTLERCQIYQDEFRRQARLFKAERDHKKQLKVLRKQENRDGEC